MSGFLTRLVARGAGVRLADAPAPLAARARSRFEPLPAVAGALGAASISDTPADETDVPAATSAHASAADRAATGQAWPLREERPDPAGSPAVPVDRRAQPARETMNPGPAVQAGRRRGDTNALTDIRSDQPTASNGDGIRHAAGQAGPLPSPSSPAPGPRPGTPRSGAGFESNGRPAHSQVVEPAQDERTSATQASRTDGSDRPDLDGTSDRGERVQGAAAIAQPTRHQQEADRPDLLPAAIPPPERAGPETLVSIGRIDVIFEGEAPQTPQAPRRAAVERTRGFAGYERVRRGIKR